jgi:hypothetical protein
VSKIGAMRERVLEVMSEHERDGMLPTSIRFVFYELEMAGVAKKKRINSGDHSERYVTVAATSLRDSGAIPWEWIVDETRSIEDYTGYGSFMDGVATVLEHVVLDPWRGEAPTIITESRSLAGVLRHAVSDFRVQIASTNGACTGFLVTKVAPTLEDGRRVIYLGDLDIAGGQIEEHSRRVLEREIDGELRWERLAITRNQIEQYGLPSIVKHDRRYKGDDGVHEAWECEAMSQRVLVNILKARLNKLLPEPLDLVQRREVRQRRKVAAILRGGR